MSTVVGRAQSLNGLELATSLIFLAYVLHNYSLFNQKYAIIFISPRYAGLCWFGKVQYAALDLHYRLYAGMMKDMQNAMQV